MLKKLFTVGLLLFVAVFSVFSEEIKQLSGTIRVVDGDTIAYSESGITRKIRLYGIDAPETSQKFGPESTQFLKKLVDGKKLHAVVLHLDVYGREISLVYADNVCVNELMVINGYAWNYKNTTPVSNSFKFHEQFARKMKNGIWKEEGNIEPWLYRKQNK